MNDSSSGVKQGDKVSQTTATSRNEQSTDYSQREGQLRVRRAHVEKKKFDERGSMTGVVGFSKK